jgi:hypothetical protein
VVASLDGVVQRHYCAGLGGAVAVVASLGCDGVRRRCCAVVASLGCDGVRRRCCAVVPRLDAIRFGGAVALWATRLWSSRLQ